MNESLKLYIGKNTVQYKTENRPRVLRIIENTTRHSIAKLPINFGVSYSGSYYAVIISPYNKVAIDIEKESCTRILFNEHLRYMQDRKLWVIKECAAKFCGLGIKAIIKNTSVDFIFRIAHYEVWRVKLDEVWGESSIFVIYRFLGNKLHVSFSVSENYLCKYLMRMNINEVVI